MTWKKENMEREKGGAYGIPWGGGSVSSRVMLGNIVNDHKSLR